MKLVGISLLVVATVSAAAHGQVATLTSDERSQGEAEVRFAARYFAQSTRDLSSVIFRNVFIGKRLNPTPNSKIVLCGQINAKNGFGGYAGFQSFIVSSDSVHVGKIVGLDVSETCISGRIFDTKDYSEQMHADLTAAG